MQGREGEGERGREGEGERGRWGRERGRGGEGERGREGERERGEREMFKVTSTNVHVDHTHVHVRK